jgi:uncharacterized membrane protein
MKIEHALHIDAPHGLVWALTDDIESWPRHTPTITSVERLDPGPLEVGSRVRIEQPRLPARTWTVTDFEPGHRLTWWTRLLGAKMIATHQVEAVDPGEPSSGTTNTLAVEFEGPTGWPVGKVFGRAVRRAIATENEGFRSAAEAQARLQHTR